MELKEGKTGWLARLVKRFGASRLGTWLFRSNLHHLDAFVLWISGGRSTLTEPLAGVPIIMLHTTGARSGEPRTVPLVTIPHQGAMIIIASNWGQTHAPAWYFNLKANPRVEVSYGGERAAYLAEEVDGERYAVLWDKAVAAYPGYAVYRRRAGGRHIPLLLLSPAPQSAAGEGKGDD